MIFILVLPYCSPLFTKPCASLSPKSNKLPDNIVWAYLWVISIQFYMQKLNEIVTLLELVQYKQIHQPSWRRESLHQPLSKQQQSWYPSFEQSWIIKLIQFVVYFDQCLGAQSRLKYFLPISYIFSSLRIFSSFQTKNRKIYAIPSIFYPISVFYW